VHDGRVARNGRQRTNLPVRRFRTTRPTAVIQVAALNDALDVILLTTSGSPRSRPAPEHCAAGRSSRKRRGRNRSAAAPDRQGRARDRSVSSASVQRRAATWRVQRWTRCEPRATSARLDRGEAIAPPSTAPSRDLPGPRSRVTVIRVTAPYASEPTKSNRHDGRAS